MNQHQSRQVAMQAVFFANQNPDLTAAEVEKRIVQTLDLGQIPAYSKTLIDGVIATRAQLKSTLASHLKKGWKLERVDPLTVAILEVALYEMKNSTAIGPKAAINEALNLCDEFVDPQAKPFVNGILANFVQK